MQDLFDERDAIGVAQAIREGEVSAREVVELVLARLDERNPVVNAVAARRDDAALAEVAAGLPDGPLTGVPFVVKDLQTPVAGMPATNGSRLFAEEVATADAEIVARYRRAGVVIVATTTTPEWGRNASTEGVLWGPTRNPHHLSHSAGGSSGGTAAAVAAGMVPVGHGNDGGGSIRIPASACGLVGLKPTRGRTPASPRRNTFSYPLGINHVLTRSVRDTALLLDVGAGALPGDPFVIPDAAGPYVDEVGAPPGRRRIGFSLTTPDGSSIHAECASVVEDAARLLAELGHDVVEAAPTYPVEALQTVMRVVMAAPMVVDIDARLAVLGRELRDDDLEPFTRVMYEMGKQLRATDVVIALRELERASQEIGPFFDEYDLLLTATIAQPVPPLGLLDTTNPESMFQHAATYAALTSPFNATGQPAISLPFGQDRVGLPVGIQLVAGFGREDLLLRVASQLETAHPWTTRPAWPAQPATTSATVGAAT